MPIRSRFVSTLRTLAGRGAVHLDLDEDVRAYRDLLVDEKVAAGIDPAEARRQATLEMGGVEQVKESVLATRPAAWLDTLARDTRFAFRVLRKTPGFSLTAIGVLGLGIAACTAVFSLVNVMLFQPMPGWDEPDRVVGIYCRDAATVDGYRPFSYPEFRDLQAQAGAFDRVAAYRSRRVGVTSGDTTRRVRGAEVSASFFETLGARLPMGRAFTADEEAPGSGAAVAILSYEGWQDLGGSPDVVGRALVINARAFTVVGVAPRGFTGVTALVAPEVWLPLGADSALGTDEARRVVPGDRRSRDLSIIGRMRPGVGLEAASAGLATLAPRLEDAVPDERTKLVLMARRAARTQSGYRPADDAELHAPMGTLLGLAVVLLVIASLNVANMQLARGTARGRELAMRLALGAGRARIVGQLLIEGAMLSLAAAAVGAVSGLWLLAVLSRAFAVIVGQATVVDVTPDVRVGLATIAFAALSTLVFGLGPAWRLSRVNLMPELKGQPGESGTHGARRGRRVQSLLVAAQTALSLALLASAGLFVRGAMLAGQADPGYRYDRQMLVRLDASLAGYDEARGRASLGAVVDRLRTLPGVESAALSSTVAFGNESSTGRVGRPGQARGGEGVRSMIYSIGRSYFRTLGLTLRDGRDFTEAEEAGLASRAAIIDEPLARALFPGREALGQQVQFVTDRGEPAGEPMVIVGIAPGLRQTLSDRGPTRHIYVPFGADYHPLMNIHVRIAAGDPGSTATMARAIRDGVRLADPAVPVLAIQTLAEARDTTPLTWMIRVGGKVLGALGLLALVMATTGLYGVKAYLVAQRAREIGIRMAIGARPSDVVRMVLADGAWLVGAALAAGVGLALLMGRVVGHMLVGVEPFDPLVLSAASAALAAASALACYLPARRATRVEPVVALRLE